MSFVFESSSLITLFVGENYSSRRIFVTWPKFHHFSRRMFPQWGITNFNLRWNWLMDCYQNGMLTLGSMQTTTLLPVLANKVMRTCEVRSSETLAPYCAISDDIYIIFNLLFLYLDLPISVESITWLQFILSPNKNSIGTLNVIYVFVSTFKMSDSKHSVLMFETLKYWFVQYVIGLTNSHVHYW